jgi:hypothetical protein
MGHIVFDRMDYDFNDSAEDLQHMGCYPSYGMSEAGRSTTPHTYTVKRTNTEITLSVGDRIKHWKFGIGTISYFLYDDAMVDFGRCNTRLNIGACFERKIVSIIEPLDNSDLPG